MTIAHPIDRAWLSTGGRSTIDTPSTAPRSTTGAQNYDEFADDAEITAIITANPTSALAVEMPHRAPDSLGVPFLDALPAAAERLVAAKSDGHYALRENVAVIYRITATDGGTGYGLWCMIDTDQISTRADEPGLVIRNEDVFPEKVRERVALARTIGHLLSPVLLLATAHPETLRAALAEAAADLGEPLVVDIDPGGRRHEIWPVPAGPRRDELLALAGGGELVVADGNHRSLAAQTAHLPRFLAVVTTPDSVAIQPYNRLVTELPCAPAELVDRLIAAGAVVEPLTTPPGVPATRGTIYVYAHGADGDDGPGAVRSWAVTLPPTGDASEDDASTGVANNSVDNLDHALVERILMRGALGLDAGDKRISYIGGDYDADWLRGEVDAGRAALAILIAPVTVADFVAVNLARLKLPRKSTWFTPKARAGLVAAEIG